MRMLKTPSWRWPSLLPPATWDARLGSGRLYALPKECLRRAGPCRGMWRCGPPVPKSDSLFCAFDRLDACGGGGCEGASGSARSGRMHRHRSCSRSHRTRWHRSCRSCSCSRCRRRCSSRSHCIMCICRRSFRLRREPPCRSSSRRGLRRSPQANHGPLFWGQRRAGRQRGAERPCRCRARLPSSGAPPHSRRLSPRRVARPAGPHPTAAARATCACGPTAARGSTVDGLWNDTRRTTRRSARSTPPGPTRTPSWSDG